MLSHEAIIWGKNIPQFYLNKERERQHALDTMPEEALQEMSERNVMTEEEQEAMAQDLENQYYDHERDYRTEETRELNS